MLLSPGVSKICLVALCAACSNLTALREFFTDQLSKAWLVLVSCLPLSSDLCTSLHQCTCVNSALHFTFQLGKTELL